jgi:AraC family transcriptional regulator
MERQPISASRFADLLPMTPMVAACSPCTLYRVDATPLYASTAFADLVLGLYTAGRRRIRRKTGGRSVEAFSDPGTLNLTPPNFDATWEADGSSHAVVLFVPDAFLSRAIEENWETDPRRVEIIPQFLTRDPVIETVMTRLALEAQQDSPSGSLYAESACEFLAHHIVHDYSSLSKSPPRRTGGLGNRLHVVVDYIRANLARRIVLRDLAALVGVSTRHLERAFRQSAGMPIHAYVLRMRVCAARDLLIGQPSLTIEGIAGQLGFSSASHLAWAFRRQTGYSPTLFRELHTRP